MGEKENRVDFLGVELVALLKLQVALKTGCGNCGRTCMCENLLNERVIELNEMLAKEIGKPHAARFFENKLGMVNELYKKDPALFRDISTIVHTKKLPEKIKNNTLTLADLQAIYQIK